VGVVAADEAGHGVGGAGEGGVVKPGGRALFVVPDGILGGSGLKAVRQWLMQEHQVVAVMSMPPETFQAAGTNTKTSLLLLRRRPAGEKASDGEMVFMAIAENIGFDSRGRDTSETQVLIESPGRRVERRHTDLFDEEIEQIRQGEEKRAEWVTAQCGILPNTGILGAFRSFEQNPKALGPTALPAEPANPPSARPAASRPRAAR
jgi:type I restriction-modification system DNA methylase subunit